MKRSFLLIALMLLSVAAEADVWVPVPYVPPRVTTGEEQKISDKFQGSLMKFQYSYQVCNLRRFRTVYPPRPPIGPRPPPALIPTKDQGWAVSWSKITSEQTLTYT